MRKRTALRDAALYWMWRLPVGKRFRYKDVRRFLEDRFPICRSRRGVGLDEAHYEAEVRAAIKDATPLKYGVIRNTGVRGEWERIGS